jgi:hypothetical protein
VPLDEGAALYKHDAELAIPEMFRSHISRHDKLFSKGFSQLMNPLAKPVSKGIL